MIVVVGQPYLRETEEGAALDGPAARIAVAAAERGRQVQLVGTAGEDEAGDEVVLALARAGVGHVALLRKAGQQTRKVSNLARELDEEPMDPLQDLPEPAPDTTALMDAGDVDLALRYLPDITVLVLAEAAPADAVAVVAQAARWSDARLIVVVDNPAAPKGLPDDAIVFEAPPAHPDGAFAQMVGSFAAALDEGDEPGNAFQEAVTKEGWAPSVPMDSGRGPLD